MLGERLRELRKQKRKTLRQVQDDLGINYSNLAQIERGEHNCNSDTLGMLAQYYGVSIDYLLGNIDKPNVVNIQVVDDDGTITDLQYELLDMTKGLTVDDMHKISEYVDFLKSRKEVKNEK
jgi:transcriptional regulator with XRE-family HTH domain